MQRSSNAMVRNVLIGSISVILLLIVLYYMKRVEVGRLKKDMDSLVVSTRILLYHCKCSLARGFGQDKKSVQCIFDTPTPELQPPLHFLSTGPTSSSSFRIEASFHGWSQIS